MEIDELLRIIAGCTYGYEVDAILSEYNDRQANEQEAKRYACEELATILKSLTHPQGETNGNHGPEHGVENA